MYILPYMTTVIEVTGQSYLSKRLKAEELPNSKITIRKYTELGIIPEPNVVVLYEATVWRFYTLEMIDQIIQKVREHRERKGTTQAHYSRQTV